VTFRFSLQRLLHLRQQHEQAMARDLMNAREAAMKNGASKERSRPRSIMRSGASNATRRRLSGRCRSSVRRATGSMNRCWRSESVCRRPRQTSTKSTRH
jgi:hypothetical protein